MYARIMSISAVSMTLMSGAAFLVVGTPPAAADEPSGQCATCSTVDLTSEGLLARARSQMNELNSVASNPPPCSEETSGALFPEDGNDTIEHHGYIRWRLTINEQHVWDDDDTTTGYRRECYLPTAPQLDGLMEVRIFDAINPQTIAQVAVDDALERIPTQTIETSPDTESLVGFDTWFWVEGVPVGGVSASASVPGMQVIAVAKPGGIDYSFGDGTGRQCVGPGVPWSPGAVSDCTHSYERAGAYTVTSTILWTGTYTVNGAGPYQIAAAVPRTDSFELPVSEAQAINTKG